MDTSEIMTILSENVPNVLTAISTAVIAIFTVVLACVGRLQARITRIVEGPIPIIRSLKLVEYTDMSGPSTVDPVPPGPIPKFCRVLPEVHNLGRTPASVTNFCINWVVSPDLPAFPNYKPNSIKTELYLRLGPNTGTWLRLDPDGDLQLTDDERQRIELRRADLWIYGFFSYQHLLGETYRVGFLARWDLIAGLRFEGRPNYIYEKRQ